MNSGNKYSSNIKMHGHEMYKNITEVMMNMLAFSAKISILKAVILTMKWVDFLK